MNAITDQSIPSLTNTNRTFMMEDSHTFTKQLLHDLRSPLGVIMLNASSITAPDSQADATRLRAANEMIVEQACLMRSILDKAERIFDLQSGRFEKQPTSLDLVDYTQRIVQEASQETSQEIEFSAETDEQVITIDPIRYREALRYLLEFFATYAQPCEPTQVHIARPNQGYVVLQLSNPCISIPSDKHDQIFTPFNRIQFSAISPDRGSGLGLFLAKTIIEHILTGQLAVAASPLPGTVFELILPAASPKD